MKTNSTIKRLSALILAGSIATIGAFAADTTDTTPAPASTPAPAQTPATPDASGTAKTAPAKSTDKHHRKHHRAQVSSKAPQTAAKSEHVWFGGIVENSRLPERHKQQGASDVQLTKVYRGSPAYKAGLRAGDVIWKFDGERLTKTAQLKQDLNAQKPGDIVRLEVFRHGKREELKVKLEAAPIATASHHPAEPHARG